VADLWQDLGDKIKGLAGTWTAYTALGSFTLYLLGYLTLRFHLTAMGISTDLAVLDERYLFAGAKFLVYLASSVPIVMLIGLVLFALIYLLSRMLGWRRQRRAGDAVKGCWQGLITWWSDPNRLSVTGIILAVVIIQFVMRQCFLFSNLLLAPSLPEPEWLQCLLLAPEEGFRSLYFSGLLAGAALTGGLWMLARQHPRHTPRAHLLHGLLAFLVAVQLLMLPVNYGILIADKTIPKVANLGNQKPLKVAEEAWLVWEGKDGVTYLVRGRQAGKEQRTLITLPRSDVKEIKIIAYDPILRVLFAERASQTLPQLESEKGGRQ
jgi:hypothetical protein